MFSPSDKFSAYDDKIFVFSFRDRCLEMYNTPIFVRSYDDLVRSLRMEYQDVLNSGAVHKSPFWSSPADYTLHHLGEFDPGTGSISPVDSPSREFVFRLDEILGVQKDEVSK